METPVQRLQARALQAVRQTKRRVLRKQNLTERDVLWNRRQAVRRIEKEVNAVYKQETRRRREDWATGPLLMPRRDVGKRELLYGAANSALLYPPQVPEKWRTPVWLAEGDRVVVLTGPDYGAIGLVEEVRADQQTVTVADLNMLSVEYPKWALDEEQQKQYPGAVPIARPISFDKVKLVFPLQGEDGAYRDVVIEKLELSKRRVRSKATGEYEDRYIRRIPGLKVEIPWPVEKEPLDKQEHDGDTLRISVDETTFTQNLMYPPMPPSIIDELRGKYSKLRTRHDPEFIKRLEDRQKTEQLSQATLNRKGMTPLQKATTAFREREAEKLASDLTEDQLVAIGKAIAQSKQKQSRSPPSQASPPPDALPQANESTTQ